jgi:hypothetical protein
LAIIKSGASPQNDVLLHILSHIQIGRVRRCRMHQMEDDVVGFDRCRERSRITKITLVPLNLFKRFGKQTAPAEGTNAMASRSEPPAKIYSQEAASAKYNAGLLPCDHISPENHPVKMRTEQAPLCFLPLRVTSKLLRNSFLPKSYQPILLWFAPSQNCRPILWR